MGEVNPGPIAYLAPARYAFVAKDIDALRARGIAVHEHLFGAGAPWQVPMALARQLLFLLRARRAGARTALVHFAGYHAILPPLLGFRMHLIIAGADACAFPGIRYGSFRKPLMRRAMGFAMRQATALLPVHASLERFTNAYSSLGPAEQGYARFVPGLRTPSIPIPYGFEPARWQGDRSEGGAHGRAGAICVAVGAAAGNAIHARKGIDLIIAAAKALPALRFTVVGAADPGSYAGLPPNLTVMGRTPQPELSALLHAHALYLQPSVMEGFPNALCEAMLCGCIPIVSGMTSMPGIVGDPRLVVARRDPALLIMALQRTAALPAEEVRRLRQEMRQRASAFTLERRVDALLQAIVPRAR